jgi:hypothetical protein
LFNFVSDSQYVGPSFLYYLANFAKTTRRDFPRAPRVVVGESCYARQYLRVILAAYQVEPYRLVIPLLFICRSTR